MLSSRCCVLCCILLLDGAVRLVCLCIPPWFDVAKEQQLVILPTSSVFVWQMVGHQGFLALRAACGFLNRAYQGIRPRGRGLK